MSAFRLDFVAVGPQRTATTWLHGILRQHPAIRLALHVKESRWFDRDHDVMGADDFAALFGDVGERITGEVGPSYFDDTDALARIAAFAPEAKIVIHLRDPVARALSLYRHHRSRGRVGSDFRAAIETMPRIVTSGRYATHAPRWEDAFGSDKVLYVAHAAIAERPHAVAESVFRFLGVQPLDRLAAADERVNASTAPRAPWLARAASGAATFLRRRGFHRVVETGKALGLKAVYRGGADSGALGREERERLEAYYAADRAFLDACLRVAGDRGAVLGSAVEAVEAVEG